MKILFKRSHEGIYLNLDHVLACLGKTFIGYFVDNGSNECYYVIEGFKYKKYNYNIVRGLEFEDVLYGDKVYSKGKTFVVVTEKDYEMIEAMKGM